MFKLSHSILISISGMVWMFVGLMLLRLGLILLVGSLDHESHPLLTLLEPYFGGLSSAMIGVLAFAFFIGYMKGHFVLGKSAQKGVERIKTFPNPTSLRYIYSPKYYVLLGSMIALGISIKYLGIPNDIRGVVDVAIGMALLKGAWSYFQHVVSLKKAVQ